MTYYRSFPSPLTLLLLLSLLTLSCCSRPPVELFKDDIQKMVLVDREIGFEEEIESIEVVDRTKYESQTEVQVRVTGWAIHRELTFGATLPAARVKRPAWALWKYFCRKKDGTWIVEEKYKVEEGFL